MTLLLIIIGIVMFMTLIVLHELGHFRASKATGVKVKEFGIWIPPKIWTFHTDKSGTNYTFNRIPLGGFCALKGDDPSNPDEFHAKDSFISANLRRKLLIIVGGVTMNLLTAWVIFTFLFRYGTKPLGTSPLESESYLMPSLNFLKAEGFATGDIKPGVVIQEVMADSLAATIGLRAGDVVMQVNGENVSIGNLSELLKKTDGTAQLALTRENASPASRVQDFTCLDKDCKLWITIAPNSDLEINVIKFWFLWAMKAGLHEIKAERNLTMTALGKLGKGLFSFNGEKTKEAFQWLAGPVGAVKMGEIMYEMGGRMAYLAFAGMISLALAIFNLLPIPALDGGRGIWILLQAIFRWKPEKYFQYEGYVNTLFFYLLLLLGVVIIVKDLSVFRAVPIPFLG